MTYLSDRSRKTKYKYASFFLLGVLFLFIIFWVAFKSNAYTFVEPAVESYGEAKSSIGNVSEFFATYTTSRKKLMQRVKKLEITVENLENEIAEKDAQLKESNLAALVFGETNTESILVMYPLVTDITRIYSTILLSKGFKDGVEKNEYVFVRGLQPVCVIKEVYTSTSLCELLSSSSVTTEAVVGSSGSTTVALTLSGRGGGTFLGDVPRDTPISVGDSVLLRSDHSMEIGKVVDVIHNNQDTSWHVFVRGVYNPVTSSIFYIRKK